VVRVEQPGQHHFTRVRKPILVKTGSIFDLRHGRAQIVTRCSSFTG
jgi:hypothetical protein